jgi:hypothetical protein
LQRRFRKRGGAAAAQKEEKEEAARVPEGIQGKEIKREGKVVWWRLLLRRTTVARSSRACLEKMTGEWFGTEEVTGFRLLSLFHVPSDFFVLFILLQHFFFLERTREWFGRISKQVQTVFKY